MACIGTDIVCPLEIVEIIVDLVASKDDSEADHPDLRACSLTSRAFVQRCREHIFRSVTLHDRSTEFDRSYRRPADIFAKLIKASPGIAEYVRELRYIINPTNFIRFGGVPIGLQNLSSLHSLDIRTTAGIGVPYTRDMIYDWSVHGNAQDSLVRLLCLPTIVSLRLNLIWNFSCRDLLRCTSLKNLHLGYVQPEAGYILTPPSIEQSAQRVELDTLVLGIGWTYWDGPWWTNAKDLDLSKLKKISFYIDEHFSRVPLIPSLETIHFAFEFLKWRKTPAEYISSISATLKTLRQLHIDISIRGRGAIYNTTVEGIDPLCGICTALEDFAGKNRIEVIRIRVEFSEELQLKEDKWGLLENALLAPNWPCLKHVDLSILPTLTTRPQHLPPQQKLKTKMEKIRKAVQNLPHTQFS